ncbi:hypothetical protein DICPUDRAFT_84524 [Dictyostelium purpureum]|uniref:Uncharacterized protein n=1 Tax=Dictyostelium purpureum TaxID=5786 RepID=F1A2X4_DICPU|nr:uncharacterized protein DICPUDRAFT_84524 [Dictyostelium purpureum]EGC29453.1 hypothetical protein DICPUDRAFT_84524 [Dictyostelium purpureum]|eukprot:XP_003294019.1 hypothetical protein DICPUDRAFT_84524 [Dictyostelium purpureum]
MLKIFFNGYELLADDELLSDELLFDEPLADDDLLSDEPLEESSNGSEESFQSEELPAIIPVDMLVDPLVHVSPVPLVPPAAASAAVMVLKNVRRFINCIRTNLVMFGCDCYFLMRTAFGLALN